MGEWKFILTYTMFIFLIAQLSPLMIIGGEGITTPSGEDIVVPTCDIEGWDAIIDAIVCVFGNLAFFFSLATVSSEFAFFQTIILAPMIVTLIWIILKMIRGVG
jgi:hypothetical protein